MFAYMDYNFKFVTFYRKHDVSEDWNRYYKHLNT